jgi:GR25 family glycosyltransferase involved in LPS biosynthesis
VHEPSKSTLACSVSHVRALRHAQFWAEAPVLILEDDVLLLPHFEARLERLWRSADQLRNPADNNMSSSSPHLFTMLGFMSNGLPPRRVVAVYPDIKAREEGGLADSLVLPSQTIGFFGYAVTAGAAGGTLRATLPLRQAIDSALHHSFSALAANNVQARSSSPSSHDSHEHCVYIIFVSLSFPESTPYFRLLRSNRRLALLRWIALITPAYYLTSRASRAIFRGCGASHTPTLPAQSSQSLTL